MKFPHNISRLEALSDGVFAFAATLMVVDLDLGGNWLDLQGKGVYLVTFAVSFFVLIAFWWVHYNYFRRTGHIDNTIIALNALLLFVVLYYVFPLKSLAETWLGKQPITLEGLASLFRWYGLGFLLIFLCFSLMYRQAYRKSRSAKLGVEALFYSRHFAIYVGVAALSIALAWLNAGIGIGLPGFSYILLGPLCYWHSRWFDQKFKFKDS